MPRRIQPPSLREASLQSIASNYRYWCVEQSDSMPGYTSPFQDLRDDMIQEVMQLLEPIGSKRINFLFHPNLRRLSLEGFQFTRDTIKFIGTNCQNLTHLCLHGEEVQPRPVCLTDSYWKGLYGVDGSPELLCHLVSNVPHLVSLGLQYTSTDRTVLKAIVENCPKLLELDVSGCRGLKSSDFLLLCYQPEHPRPSPQLTKLSFFIPHSGFAHFHLVALLNSHPNLKSLGNFDYTNKLTNCVSINQAFDDMYGQKYQIEEDFEKEWIRNLMAIIIRSRKNKILDINLTILCCPYVTRLHLDFYNGRLNSLGVVSTLKFLTNFSVFGGTFTGEIETVLEQIGGNLTHLCLSHTYGVHVGRIGELCPNLQYLKLVLKTPVSFSTSNSIDQHFRQLQKLRIIDLCSNYGVPTEALSLMLENATEITELYLAGVGNLTDRIISQADKKRCFRFLKKANFFRCKSLSKETGMIVLSDGNPLQHLYLRCCDITLEDSRDLEEYAKHKRFNVVIGR